MNFRNNLTAFSWKLRNRGMEDILIAVVDGLKGFPEAITTLFPLASVQTCIVHLSRYCLSFCGWKERQALTRELKEIYRAETVEAAAKRLSEFEAGPWGKKYPMIAESWRRNWQQIIPFYGYPPEVRKIVCTTNAIESLHMQLRKVLKNRGQFPSDEAATKLIYLALRNITKSWKNSPLTWRMEGECRLSVHCFGGLPMKPATNVFADCRKSVNGSATCMIFPWRITQMRSPIVIAST